MSVMPSLPPCVHWWRAVLERARHDSGLQSCVVRLWASHFLSLGLSFLICRMSVMMLPLPASERKELLLSIFSMWGLILDVLPYRSYYTLLTILRSWYFSYFTNEMGVLRGEVTCPQLQRNRATIKIPVWPQFVLSTPIQGKCQAF